MKFSCLCPTYKRPQFLANAVACFDQQDYPEWDRELIVLDDAGQFYSYQERNLRNIQVISLLDRLSSLTAKFNHLAKAASGDVFVIWEDDDIFLPWHLSTIAESIERGGEFVCYKTVYSTYDQPFGRVQEESAAGRFHSSWAFTRELFQRVGGYPNTTSLTFDQQIGAQLRKYGKVETNQCEQPGYVYRWGNGIYHGSQAGDEGFARLWKQLESIPAPFIGYIEPKLDQETQEVMQWLMKPQSIPA